MAEADTRAMDLMLEAFCILDDLKILYNTGSVDIASIRLRRIWRVLNYGKGIGIPPDVVHTTEELIATLKDRQQESESTLGAAALELCGAVGRHSHCIEKETLEFYIEHGFTIPMVAQILRVSEATVKRRMNTFEPTVSVVTYSKISEEELDKTIRYIKQTCPNDGIGIIKGRLMALGHRVQYTRTEMALRRVDPIGVLKGV